MAAEFYTTFLYEIHREELIAEMIGEQQHKLCILAGFSVSCNPLVFMRLQPFLMRHHRGDILVDFERKKALAPKVMGGCEASEGIHSIVSEGINNWTSRTEHAFKTVVETLRDLNITIPGCRQPVHPRGQTEMGGDIPEGMSIVDLLIQIDGSTNHFFYEQRKNASPSAMKYSKRTRYCNVFGVSDKADFYFCESCNEYFAHLPDFPHIDNSSRTMEQKLSTLVGSGENSWLVPSHDEVLELDDTDSLGRFLGVVCVPVPLLLNKYLHFKLQGVACHLCTVGYVLFRGIWKDRAVGELLSFVSDSRVANVHRQETLLQDILTEVKVDDMGEDEETFDLTILKGALKQKGINVSGLVDVQESEEKSSVEQFAGVKKTSKPKALASKKRMQRNKNSIIS